MCPRAQHTTERRTPKSVAKSSIVVAARWIRLEFGEQLRKDPHSFGPWPAR